MILPQKLTTLQDSRLTLTAANFAQQTIRVPLPRTWALEEIFVTVQVQPKAAITTQLLYGLLNILRRVQLEINDGIQPRMAVNCTGPGLLQLVSNEGISLDRSTLQVLAQLQAQAAAQATGGFLANGGNYRVTYRIPLVHPMITGPLRSRMLLPVHLHPQDPTLVLDFAGAAELFSGVADPFTASTGAAVEVWLLQREIPRAFGEEIKKSAPGGDPRLWFLRSDINETIYPVPITTNTEQRFEIPKPGQYSSLAIHMTKGTGSATMDLADISASTTLGSETRWRLESGGNLFREWRMKQLQTLNDYSRAASPAGLLNPRIPTLAASLLATSGTTTVTATDVFVPGQFGGSLSAQGIQSPSSVFLDFLSDGIGDAEELGSLLDCNLPAVSGLKMEIIGNVTLAAAGTFQIVGRRFFDELSRWQTVQRIAA
jgi:hypothetical protein